MTVTLSLAMIVKNEEKLLGRVLADAADVCDEMVVIDTGSTDGTRLIAEAAGATVHEIEWRDDFATARNASFAWTNCDWIMWLDADDVLPPSTKDAIRGLKESLDDDLDMVSGPYHYQIADDDVVLLRSSRERLIRRESYLRWEGRIHEIIPIPDTRTMFAPDLIVEHRPDADRRQRNYDRNIQILEKEMGAGYPSARTLFYYANELFDHQRFADAARIYRRYLEVQRRPSDDHYWAYLYLAESERALGNDEAVIDASMHAVAEDPSRAEAYVCMGRVFYDREDWAKAVPLFSAATTGTPPGRGFTRGSDYLYGPWDFLSVCLDRLGRRREALVAAERALPGNPEADRIRANMRWIVDNL